MDLPKGTNEAVTKNEDGTFSIFISSRLCDAKRLKAYRHALKHIDGDFDRQDVQSIEWNVRQEKTIQEEINYAMFKMQKQ